MTTSAGVLIVERISKLVLNGLLNLRKKYLYDLIKGMDEERLSKVETYIKRLCLAKQKESLYPWAPDEAELTCKIAESEVDFNNGDYCTQKALKKKLQKKLASW